MAKMVMNHWYGAVIAFFLIQSSIFLAQTSTTTPNDSSSFFIEPVGEEAFWALAQFFDYDNGQPLNPRIVETVEEEIYTREKIVFSGVRGDRVPGYLGMNPIAVEVGDYSVAKRGWIDGKPPTIKRRMNYGYKDISNRDWVDCV